MSLGRVVAVMADVHGEYLALHRALELCRAERVETIALLGDLFDRPDQADRCALLLAGWPVIGVYGNHEREIAISAARRELELRPETVRLLSSLRERLVIGDVCFTHEILGQDWADDGALYRDLRSPSRDGRPRVKFAGHTHYRQAWNDRGPLDISRGWLALDPRRRYLINPGALAAGQFAIWHRSQGLVVFREVDGSKGHSTG